MDIIAIKTTEEFLKQNKQNTALVYLNNGKEYETDSIYKIIEPTIGNFAPLIVIDVNRSQEDLAIIPVANIHHIIIKGPEKKKKLGFFIDQTKR